MVIARQKCAPISVRKYYVLDDNGTQELAMEYDIKLSTKLTYLLLLHVRS